MRQVLFLTVRTLPTNKIKQNRPNRVINVNKIMPFCLPQLSAEIYRLYIEADEWWGERVLSCGIAHPISPHLSDTPLTGKPYFQEHPYSSVELDFEHSMYTVTQQISLDKSLLYYQKLSIQWYPCNFIIAVLHCVCVMNICD